MGEELASCCEREPAHDKGLLQDGQHEGVCQASRATVVCMCCWHAQARQCGHYHAPEAGREQQRQQGGVPVIGHKHDLLAVHLISHLARPAETDTAQAGAGAPAVTPHNMAAAQQQQTLSHQRPVACQLNIHVHELLGGGRAALPTAAGRHVLASAGTGTVTSIQVVSLVALDGQIEWRLQASQRQQCEPAAAG